MKKRKNAEGKEDRAELKKREGKRREQREPER